MIDKLIAVEKEMLVSLKKDYPAFNQGDIINVHYKIREKDKERIQHLEGVVIKIQGEMHRKSFTLRRIAYGEAYEISFPYYSPNIAKIAMVKKTAKLPRKKKLYYLRDKTGKQAMLA